jgi:molybdenum cofactor cytidylyltransferase
MCIDMSMSQAFAIVPAAGESLRMQRPKLLLRWRGKTLLEHVLAAWRASQVRATLVVVRPDDIELASLAEKAGALVVRPPLPPPDMRASVSFGLGEIRRLFSPHSRDAWLVAPADMPRLSTAVIDCLIGEHEQHPDEAVVPTVAGERGHPVLFPWHCTLRVRQLAADEGLNVLLRDGPVREIDCSDLVQAADLADVDTPEDYQELTGGRDLL